jgi:cytochrome P450
MKTALPPGPRDRLFGMSLMRDMQRDFVGFWREQYRRHGDVVHMRLLNYRHYSFFHPHQIREVLVEKADSFVRFEHPMRVLAQLQGQSVLISEGEAWKKQRRTLQPGFSPKRFPAYAAQMTNAIGETLATLPLDAKPVDFEHTMNHIAIDVILRTMFSTKVAEDSTQIEHAVRKGSEIANAEMFLPFMVPGWLPIRHNAEKREAFRVLDDLVWSHIRARRASGESRDDLLGMMLSAADEEDGSKFSDRQVHDEMMTTFMAGHETNATGLTWAGWALAAHPEVAARVTAEVDQVLGGRTPTFEDVAHLPYLGAFLKECLRLYPPALGVFLRRAVEDVRIGDWLVPEGSLVNILSIIPHMDPRWFPDPGRFDPSRFLGDAAKSIERGAYLPFGTGPRVCIGQGFATMEMTLILAMLLQRFSLRPAPGQQQPGIRMQVTLRPLGGLHLVLTPRALASTPAAPVQHKVADAVGCPFH